ncbi:GntR family transcriptional regulator [Mycolicibacterium vaccae]|nr:GntR family transcriptional regulator [Mycolicibacterium vaccae]
MTTLRPGAEHVDAAWLAQRLPATSSKDLGHGLARLIDGGELPPGAHLPTIRDFARAAGVSPGTVMTAWSRVRDSGRLHTRRRGGTVVADLHRPAPAAHPTVGWSHIEMALVAPDPALQPDLGPALAEGLRGTPDLHNPERAYISDRLRRSVEGSWPFDAQAWNCVGGGSEAVVLATAAAASGGPIGVEEPVSPGYLDVLRQLGIEAIGVRADEHGPTVASVRSAVRAGATGAGAAAQRRVRRRRGAEHGTGRRARRRRRPAHLGGRGRQRGPAGGDRAGVAGCASARPGAADP